MTLSLTETEAKTKWCPFARYTKEDGGGGISPARNRWIDQQDTQLSPGPARCIASGCMAWRWEHAPPENRVSGEEIGTGFCGLAGHPAMNPFR